MKNISKLMAAAAILMLLAGCSAKTDTTAAESAKGAGETAKEAVNEGTGAAVEMTADATSPAASNENGSAEEDGADDNSLPYSLDDGKLCLNSLFTFDGVNPDADYAECEECASIELVNTSDRFLTRADIAITLENGTQLEFIVEALAADEMVCAFDTDNQSYDGSAVADIRCTADYSDQNLLGETVKTEADGIAVTLCNESSDDIGVTTVYYHDVIDGTLFGGKANVISIEGIAGYGDITVTADNSMMGQVSVSGVIAE